MVEKGVPPKSLYENNRLLKNIFIAPSRQFKFAALTIGIGFVTLFSLFGFELWILSSLLKNLSAHIPADTTLPYLISEALTLSWAAFLVAGLLFGVLVLVATIVVSHRLYGPVFAMRKHVSALARGEYSHRTRLRKEDEFKDLANDLNELSEAFESRSR